MSYKIVAKYIKKLDFGIDNPKAFFLIEQNISKYKINIDIKSNQYKENIIEVETTLALNAIESSDKGINTKITYSTIIEVESNITDKKKLEELILIQVPTEIYPEIRNIFISLFEKCGFSKINIEENVNFKELYLRKKN